MTGFEPATSGATVRRSTAELHPPYRAVTAHTSRHPLQETLIVTYRAVPIRRLGTGLVVGAAHLRRAAQFSASGGRLFCAFGDLRLRFDHGRLFPRL